MQIGSMKVVEQSGAIQLGGSDRNLEMATSEEVLRRLASGSAVVVFSMSGCCMCHVVKSLFFSLGAGPTIIELDHHASGSEIQSVLYQLAGAGGPLHQPLPAVFVGGKFLGGIETLMACHINGTLVPRLKDAGALWL